MNRHSRPPPLRFVLALFTAVALLQFPVDAFMRRVSIIGGVILNEVGVILVLPIAALWIAGYRPSFYLEWKQTPRFKMLAAVALAVGPTIALV